MNNGQFTLFVIDDDLSVRKALQRLLKAHQYQVECYTCAEAYLARAAYTGVGAIILDLSLPGLDGMELQVKLHQDVSRLPIIFLTAHGDIHKSVTAMKQGAENFLTKPVDESQLLCSVTAAINHHLAIQQKQNIIQNIRQNIQSLTTREFEILRYVISGALNKQIAYQLNIAEKTVKVHRGRVLDKMQANSIVDLVRKCDVTGIQPLHVTGACNNTLH